jgi:hypothetical protein
MSKFLVHIRFNLILLYRISFRGKEKVSFLAIGSLGYIFLYLLCYKTDLSINEISSCFLIIGGIFYHGFQESNSFKSFHLFPFYIDKSKSLMHGFGFRLLSILIICIPFIFCFQTVNVFSVTIFFCSIFIFTFLLYILSDLSIVNKGIFYLFRFLAILPIIFIDLSSIRSKEQDLFQLVLMKNSNKILIIQLIILLLLSFIFYFYHRKYFYERIIK